MSPPLKRDLTRAEFHQHASSLGPGPGGGPLAGGLRLFRSQTFEVDDPGLPVLLSITVVAKKNRLVASQVNVTARDEADQMVTGELLRSIPIDAYVKRIKEYLLDASAKSAPYIVAEVGGTVDTVFLEPPSVEQVNRAIREGRKRVPASELLPQMVALYREALGDPEHQHAPVDWVARQLGYSKGHVARQLVQARKVGLLGPAEPGRAGESRSSRGGKKEGRKRG